MTLSPRSPYAASKAAGESFLAAFQAAFGLEAVMLRYFNVYGIRQSSKSLYAAVVPLFVEAVLQGKPVQVFGDGQQTRDFTYVGDVVRALRLAADAPPESTGLPVNIAGGRRVSILELAETIGELAGSPARVVNAPARAGDVRHSLADVSRARALLGWEPKTDLRDGLARVVAAARASIHSSGVIS
jgi:nucleoside-diphosphate-sugar epimerase